MGYHSPLFFVRKLIGPRLKHPARPMGTSIRGGGGYVQHVCYLYHSCHGSTAALIAGMRYQDGRGRKRTGGKVFVVGNPEEKEDKEADDVEEDKGE